MRQRLFVDRGVLVAYLALSLAACRSAPGALVPVGAAPVSREQVSQWVNATVPAEHRLHRFKWLFQDERSSAGGRGSARIAPPDSMRFDVAGPVGFGGAPAAGGGGKARGGGTVRFGGRLRGGDRVEAALGRAAGCREEVGAQLPSHVGHVRRRATAR